MRIAISGANGRMGRILIESVLQSSDLKLTVALNQSGSSEIGQDAGAFLGIQTGVIVTDDLNALQNADCLIDFTLPNAMQAHADACVKYGIKYVIGTTGFNEEQIAYINKAAQDTAVVFAPNMSYGVNATLKILELAAKLFEKGYDAEVFEAHHRNKVDAPSGTALAMGQTIAKAWDVNLDDVADWARHGVTGKRKDGNIGFSVVRGGDIVGDHTVFFCGTGERIEITHKSSSRATYAQGSLQAARFLANKDKGLFSMQDVIGA